MNTTRTIYLFLLIGFSLAGAEAFSQVTRDIPPDENAAKNVSSAVEVVTEKHLRNVRQLSFGGENAEAYFNGDGTQLIFQSKREGRNCDQIYTMRADAR